MRCSMVGLSIRRGIRFIIPLVFVDSNVLYPVRLADRVLSSVDDRVFEICVSEDLLDEIERVLIKSKGLVASKAKTFRDAVGIERSLCPEEERICLADG
jgi:hypothetical protein